MTADNTVSRSLHDLGLATWFGGSLMGAVGLNGAAADLEEPKQRLRVANAGWNRWTPVNLAGIAAHLAGGAVLLGANKGRVAGQQGQVETDPGPIPAPPPLQQPRLLDLPRQLGVLPPAALSRRRRPRSSGRLLVQAHLLLLLVGWLPGARSPRNRSVGSGVVRRLVLAAGGPAARR